MSKPATLEDALRPLVEKLVMETLAKMAPANDALLTTREAAALARVTLDTIRRWIASGDLAAKQAGRVHRVRRADLEAMLAGKRRKSSRISPEEQARRDFR